MNKGDKGIFHGTKESIDLNKQPRQNHFWNNSKFLNRMDKSTTALCNIPKCALSILSDILVTMTTKTLEVKGESL